LKSEFYGIRWVDLAATTSTILTLTTHAFYQTGTVFFSSSFDLYLMLWSQILTVNWTDTLFKTKKMRKKKICFQQKKMVLTPLSIDRHKSNTFSLCKKKNYIKTVSICWKKVKAVKIRYYKQSNSSLTKSLRITKKKRFLYENWKCVKNQLPLLMDRIKNVPRERK
jgi:hypothetical protein